MFKLDGGQISERQRRLNMSSGPRKTILTPIVDTMLSAAADWMYETVDVLDEGLDDGLLLSFDLHHDEEFIDNVLDLS